MFSKDNNSLVTNLILTSQKNVRQINSSVVGNDIFFILKQNNQELFIDSKTPEYHTFTIINRSQNNSNVIIDFSLYSDENISSVDVVEVLGREGFRNFITNGNRIRIQFQKDSSYDFMFFTSLDSDIPQIAYLQNLSFSSPDFSIPQ